MSSRRAGMGARIEDLEHQNDTLADYDDTAWSFAAGVAVTFEAEGRSLCALSQTATSLRPSQCEDVTCTWTTAPAAPVEVTVIADDAEAGFARPYRECREGNNRAVFAAGACDLKGTVVRMRSCRAGST